MKESHYRAAAPRTWQRRAQNIALRGAVVTTVGFGLLPDGHHAGTGAKPSDYIAQIEDSGSVNPDGSCHDQVALRCPGRVWSAPLVDDLTMRYHAAALSPNGRALAFGGTRMEPGTETPVEEVLYVGEILYHRSGRPRCLGKTNLAAAFPAGAVQVVDLTWTPDSRGLLLEACLPAKHPAGQRDIFLYRLDTGKLCNMTGTPDVSEFCPVPSPHSDHVAFMRTVREGKIRRHEIYTIAITGGPPRRVTNPANTGSRASTYPRWTPDSTGIEFRDLNGKWWRIPADGSRRARPLPGGA